MSAESCVDPFCAEHSPLMKATVRFWMCPVREHRVRRDVVTVEWRDGVAHCTAPDCGRTNAPPADDTRTAAHQRTVAGSPNDGAANSRPSSIRPSPNE